MFKDQILPNESYDPILHKVMATCSRVEQRLSDKRKVYESTSSHLVANDLSKGRLKTACCKK